LLRLGSEWAQAGYAHVFDLHRSLRSRLLTWRLRARLRAGFHKQEVPRWVLVNLHRDVYVRFGGAQPLRERMLEPLRRLGAPVHLHDTRLVLPEPSQSRAARRLRNAGIADSQRLLALAPGARWTSKRWPTQRWVELVQRLRDAVEHTLVLLGAPAEAELCAPLRAAAPERCLDLCGRLDVLETAAVLERCDAVVTHDSGLLHVAEAMGRPVLALFGATAPQFGYAPYRDASRLLHEPPPCNPCSKNGSRACRLSTHECMENLSVERVWRETLALIERAGRPSPTASLRAPGTKRRAAAERSPHPS
jgi:lipopolysaccharide heptosyltransferase II